MNLEELYRVLRSSHVQAQGVMDTIDAPLLVLDERGCVIDANRAFFGTFRVEREDVIDRPMSGLGNGEWDIPELTRLVAEIIPRSTAVIDYEVTHDFPKIGVRTFLLTARRMWKPDDNSTKILLVFHDVTETRRQEADSALLSSDLRHRLINLLSVVGALARQTETKGQTAEEYRHAFLGRIEALVKVQSLRGPGDGPADLASIVAAVAGGLGGDRLAVSGGPEVIVSEKQAIPLAMILHELATNALKYGALAPDAGTVDVAWTVEPGPAGAKVRLAWREKSTAAPPCGDVSRTGRGTGIMTASARGGLGGSLDLRFADDGLAATLEFPLATRDR